METTTAYSEPSASPEQDSLQSIRDRVLNVVTVTLAIVALPGLLASLARTLDIGWQNIMYVHIASYLIVLLTAIFRKRLGYGVRAGVVFFVLSLTGVASIVSWGLVGNFTFMVIIVVLATVLYGIRAGMISLGAVILFLSAVALAVRLEILTFSNVDYIQYATAISTWVSRITSFGFFGAAMVAAAGLLYRYLVDHIDELRAANKALESEVEQRRKAQAELEEYKEHLEKLVEERTSKLSEANERLEKLGRLKDEFVSNVSHELRTPIFSIKLHLDLLAGNREKTETYLDTLRRETTRLERIIEDLLHLSRLDQNRVDMMLAPIDFNALANEYVSDRQPVAESNGLSLTFAGHEPLPLAQGDKGLLGQVLSILLTNALNYTPPGGQIVVRTQLREEKGKRWVGFSVTDTGPGISIAEQEQLFKRFFRGEVGRKSGVAGTGLGLAIVQQITDQHTGQVEVISEGLPGKGATFRVWLPATNNGGVVN